MIFLGELRVEAIFDNLRAISLFIHSVAQRLEMTEKNLFDLELAVEEAAANIARHAYPEGQIGEMSVSAEAIGDVVRVTLTDWGNPIDPSKVTPFDINAPVETRIKGGMGLHFINSLTDAMVRKTASKPGGPNTLTLVKHIERMPPGAHRADASRELDAMLSVSQIMATNIDLDDLLTLIINELAETLGADRGTLYLVDEETGELFSRVLMEDPEVTNEIRININEGIAGDVATTGNVLNIRDAYSDPRFNPDIDRATGFLTNTILAAPMRNPGGKIIGVVQLLNKKGGPFTSRDERILTAMAAQAAISIENARLYAQEIQQRLVNQELETGRSIQKSFLPQHVPQSDGWDIAAFWSPMREVGGDFYDLYVLPDGRLAALIADVSGKGVPAALFMALTVSVFRFAMSLNMYPGELLGQINQLMIENQQSRMFATVFIGYVDYASGEAQFACAGHNPPMLYRAGTGTVERLSAKGVAMGLFPGVFYEERRFSLAPGDVLVLYTDGIDEMINKNEEDFGEARLQAIIEANTNLSAEKLSQLIIKSVADFVGGQGIFDDQTLVIVKRLPTQSPGLQ